MRVGITICYKNEGILLDGSATGSAMPYAKREDVGGGGGGESERGGGGGVARSDGSVRTSSVRTSCAVGCRSTA